MIIIVTRCWCFCGDYDDKQENSPPDLFHCGTKKKEKVGSCGNTIQFCASSFPCGGDSSSSGVVSLLLFVGSDLHRISELVV